MDRSNHYEAAFEAYLQWHRLCYVAVDETRRAWLGDLRFDSRNGFRVASLVPPTWPIYSAGLDEDDELQSVDGQRIAAADDLAAAVQKHKPGDTVRVVFVDRTGAAKTASVTLAEDPHIEVVPVDAGSLTPAQKAFRDSWLSTKVK